MNNQELEDLRNSWVFQEKGQIDKYNPNSQMGTQPVRVIHNMLVMMFRHSYPDFLAEMKHQVDEGKLNPKIDFIFAEEAIRDSEGRFHTPRVSKDTRMIELHETFLSYLWSVSYAIFILYLETIDYPAMNEIAGYEKYPVSEKEIRAAKDLFDYSKSLIAFYSDWDKEQLPNPEVYFAEKRDYPEQSTLFYTEAVKFILAHEYTHLKLHIDQIDDQTLESHYLEYEYEADNEAIKILLKGADPYNIYAVCGGIVIGILSMFFFGAKTTGAKHPNAEDRLTNALEQLPEIENDLNWGFACIGLELWDQQFGLNFEKLPLTYSKRSQYYNYIEQIKNRN